MKEKPDHLPLEQAQQILLDRSRPLGVQSVPLPAAFNRVIAQDIVADENIPPFDRSPYDGYAFIAADTAGASRNTPVRLIVDQEIPAGHTPLYPAKKGFASKILTGAPLPEGADAVVKFEIIEKRGDSILIFEPHSAMENIVLKGEDISVGSRVLSKGTSVFAPEAGLLAALGIAEVPVYTRPRIAIVGTGDELLNYDRPLLPGKIRNSSRHTVESVLTDAGANAFYAGTAPDRADSLAALLKDALASSDMAVTLGGVSVGDYDMTRFAIDRLGAETLFWKVDILPGGSVLAATLDGKIILGLSGNPGAAAVALYLLGIPCVSALAGKTGFPLERLQVHLMEDFPKASRKRRFIWGKLTVQEGRAGFQAPSRQASGILRSLRGADLLGEIPAGTPFLPKGALINAYKIR